MRRDFFENDEIVDYSKYDYNISFDIIDKLYDLAMNYEELLNIYNKYQSSVTTLSVEERKEIENDERFVEIKRKLDLIHRFNTCMNL